MKRVVNARPGPNQQKDASTFCAVNAVRTAESQGWRFAKGGRSVTITNNQRTWTMGADLTNGGLYLFPMNPIDAQAHADVLGLQRPGQISSQERQRAFSGTSRPSPARMKLVLSDGSTINSFCSSSSIDNALNQGWQLTESEVQYD